MDMEEKVVGIGIKRMDIHNAGLASVATAPVS